MAKSATQNVEDMQVENFWWWHWYANDAVDKPVDEWVRGVDYGQSWVAPMRTPKPDEVHDWSEMRRVVVTGTFDGRKWHVARDCSPDMPDDELFKVLMYGVERFLEESR